MLTLVALSKATMKEFNFDRFNFTPTLGSRQAVSVYHRQLFSRALALHRRNGITQAQYKSLLKDGLISAEHLSSLKVRPSAKSKRAKTKLHKRHSPKVVTGTIKFSIGKQLSAPLAKHNINLNPYYRELRIRKNMRLNVRDEAEEITKALFPLLIKYCDYSVHSEFLFEVKAPLRQIAYEMGLLEQTERYDRLHRALETMQEAGLIVAIHEFDMDLYRQKAMRIFLLPDFFYSIGHTPERLRSLVANLDRHYTRKGKNSSIAARNQAHEERLKRANVADIRSNNKTLAYYELLKTLRKEFLSDAAFRKAENFMLKAVKKAECSQKETFVASENASLCLSQDEIAQRWTELRNNFERLKKPPS